MAKTRELTLKDLDGVTSLDDLPSLRPLHAEVERRAADLAALENEAQAIVADKASYSPYKLGKLEERRAPLESALAQARLRVDEERARLQREIDALFQPALLETITRLTRALEKVAPIDAELRDMESLRSRFVPFAGRIRVRHSADDLRQLAHYVDQQKPH
jgi:hypothetical protein